MQVFEIILAIFGVSALVLIFGAIWFWLSLTANGANPFR